MSCYLNKLFWIFGIYFSTIDHLGPGQHCSLIDWLIDATLLPGFLGLWSSAAGAMTLPITPFGEVYLIRNLQTEDTLKPPF